MKTNETAVRIAEETPGIRTHQIAWFKAMERSQDAALVKLARLLENNHGHVEVKDLTIRTRVRFNPKELKFSSGSCVQAKLDFHGMATVDPYAD